jgi:hypothetical protein
MIEPRFRTVGDNYRTVRDDVKVVDLVGLAPGRTSQ